MELCTPQSLPSLPKLTTSRLRSFPPSSSSFRHHSRFTKLVTRASEESRLGGKPFFPTEVSVVVEETPNVEDKTVYGENGPTKDEPSNAYVDGENGPTEPPKEEDAYVDGEQNEFLANLKLDSDNTYTFLLYGGGALLFLWLSSAVVRAVDSIPLFSKLMEVVGLGYATWFTIRYVLFKRNREELIAKFDDLKRQIIGSNDD